ncbi:MAG: radical SAM protein [Bellilinea sp.]
MINLTTQETRSQILAFFDELWKSNVEISRLLDLVEQVADNETAKRLIPRVRRVLAEYPNLLLLINRTVRELNPRMRQAFLINFVLNQNYGQAANRRKQFEREEGFAAPYTFIISPSMRCNLKCEGCYAGEYEHADDLSIEIIHRVIQEGKDIGIYLFTILGGEPFLRTDLWEMYTKHEDSFFQVFTNGTTLTDKVVKRLAKLGNVVPVISIDGFEKENDSRRGQGTFKRITDAMDRLRDAGLLFGFSSVITRQNTELICGDEFNSLLAEKGCYFGWHFLYMPIGRNPNPNLMPTPEQRNYMRVHGASRIRTVYPMIVIDFWNDAPFIKGCVAAGRRYFHINNRGDAEPCIFAHFATDNVKEKSLYQILHSPFFRGIRSRQPFSTNHLLPCSLIDHPHIFREIHAEFKPYSTHPGAEMLVTDLAAVLDDYSSQNQKLMENEEPDGKFFRKHTAN